MCLTYFWRNKLMITRVLLNYTSSTWLFSWTNKPMISFGLNYITYIWHTPERINKWNPEIPPTTTLFGDISQKEQMSSRVLNFSSDTQHIPEETNKWHTGRFSTTILVFGIFLNEQTNDIPVPSQLQIWYVTYPWTSKRTTSGTIVNENKIFLFLITSHLVSIVGLLFTHFWFTSVMLPKNLQGLSPLVGSIAPSTKSQKIGRAM